MTENLCVYLCAENWPNHNKYVLYICTDIICSKSIGIIVGTLCYYVQNACICTIIFTICEILDSYYYCQLCDENWPIHF